MTTALFIGRFQPFHKGHLEVVMRMMKKYSLVKIAIGSSQEQHTQKNPFSFEERKSMIELSMKQHNISNYKVYNVPDINDNNKWVQHTLKITGEVNVVVTGNELVRSLFEGEDICVEWINERYFNIIAENIRRAINQQQNWKQFVDPAVHTLIQKFDGEERIKHLQL